jgi:ABC-type transport system involved in cytochrome bd biosynthesis fused ATPase/permease subunit
VACQRVLINAQQFCDRDERERVCDLTYQIDLALLGRAIEEIVDVEGHIALSKRKADRILVLHHGQLREEGKHKELVALDGIYARLVKLQFGSS